MKTLTEKEFLKAPDVVKFLHAAKISGVPIGAKMLDEAIRDYPEYFPEEVAFREKWDLIPDSVHEQYWIERNKITEECHRDVPESKGVLGWVNDPEAYKEWHEAYEKARLKEEPLLRDLHEKYYGGYGIEWFGF